MRDPKRISDDNAAFQAKIEEYARTPRPPPTCWKCSVEVPKESHMCESCAVRLTDQDRGQAAHRAAQSMPPRFRWARGLHAPELRERVKVDDFDKLVKKLKAAVAGTGPIGFFGPAGSGKSSLMAAVLVQWAAGTTRPWLTTEREIEHFQAGSSNHFDYAFDRVAVSFVDAFSLATARARHALGADEAPELERAIDTGFLGIDELGAEVGRDTSIVEVLHGRHNADRRIAWTSGLTKEDLLAKYGSGVWRRLSEGGTIIRLGGK